MSRFNKQSSGTLTTNVAGGTAYKQSPEIELIGILLTSFAQDEFYRSAGDTFDRLKKLIIDCDKKFVAQAAIYARNEFGMRSITHVIASELAPHISGKEWAKAFYNKIVRRPDDMIEILAYHFSKKNKLPRAMKKGFAQAFDKFDAYQLAKYRGEGKTIKLVDVVNCVHPVPHEKNAKALKELMNGTLRSMETWETKLTLAGQKAKTEEQKAELKKKAWTSLLNNNELGYIALLRNLRNIMEQAPEALDVALNSLTNTTLIKKSLVFPFQYFVAYKEIKENSSGNSLSRKVLKALTKAVDISLSNVPKFEGETLVALDVSGSMSAQSGRAKYTCAEIGALFTAAIVKTLDCDVMEFGSDASYRQVNTMDSTLTIAEAFPNRNQSTNFHAIFNRANKKYDRIIILSDEQGWVGIGTPKGDFNKYCQKFSVKPKVYSFDLQNYGTMQLPEQDVYCIAGFSDKIFTIMERLEEDRKALINEVKRVAL